MPKAIRAAAIRSNSVFMGKNEHKKFMTALSISFSHLREKGRACHIWHERL